MKSVMFNLEFEVDFQILVFDVDVHFVFQKKSNTLFKFPLTYTMSSLSSLVATAPGLSPPVRGHSEGRGDCIRPGQRGSLQSEDCTGHDSLHPLPERCLEARDSWTSVPASI